jgi:hypothetical protein
VIVVDWRESLYDVQLVAVEVARPIEPRSIVVVGRVDHERRAFPPAVGRAHEEIDDVGIGPRRLVHVDVASQIQILVIDDDVASELEYLKWVGHIRDARHARHVAVSLGIGFLAIRKILFSLLERPRLIRNRPSLDDALSGGNTGRAGVVLEIPRCSVLNLPDSLEIGLTERRLRRNV